MSRNVISSLGMGEGFDGPLGTCGAADDAVSLTQELAASCEA